MLPLILGLIDLTTRLLPVIQKMKLAGELTPEQQTETRDAYMRLHAAGSSAFDGPEWQPSSETGPNPTNQP